MQLKIGADPELFLVNKQGSYRSAFGVIQGTKKEPFKVDKGAYQVDGMAAEFNIDPASTEDEFVENIKAVMARLKTDVGPDYKFKIVDTCTFKDEVLQTQPKEALELGCDPDWDAYTMATNRMPVPRVPGFRTAAGHIHVGFIENEPDPTGVNHMTRCQTLIKQMDRFVGVPLRLLEKDSSRRNLYGASGAFRPKSYGVEYRTPSNVWIQSEEYTRFAYRCAVAAVEELLDGYRAEEEMNQSAVHGIIDCGIGGTAMKRQYMGHYARNVTNTRLSGLIEEALTMAARGDVSLKPAGFDHKAENIMHGIKMARFA